MVESLSGMISHLLPKKALVAGDLMLDTYTVGKVRRISPEAPVSVLQVESQEHRPGGTGNVILNLVSLGAHVVALGRVGNDPAGNQLRAQFEKEGVDVQGLFTQADYPTPVKNRIIAENQQIVRVDFEKADPLPEILEEVIIAALPQLLSDVDVVALSDYAKGFLSRTLLAELIEGASMRGIPVIVDPKGVDFSKYAKATIIKPNLSEAIAASALAPEASLDHIAEKLLAQAQADALFITRSESGIATFTREGFRADYPVKVREVRDVTGAGDTVLAILTLAVANGLPLETGARLSNVAAGIAIEHFGCARVTLSEVARRLLEEDTANKVFDEAHLAVLREALRGTDYVVLGISGREGMTTALFKAIREASKRARDLILYVRDDPPDPDFVDLIASLREVTYIVLKAENLRSLCATVKPQDVFFLEDGALKPADLALSRAL